MKASESVERYDSEVRLYTNYAIKNIKKVCKDFGPRPVGSEAEKNAQLHMKKELESSCDTVTREEYKCSDKAFMAWVPLGAILILFSIVMFTLGIPVASLAASLVTLFIILAEFIFYKPVLDVFFPKKTSGNVIGVRKASGEKHDVESMNRVVQRMVAEALQCNSVVSILDTDVEESIFSPGFIEQLNGVKLPATRLEVLIKMLRRSIAQYKNTNKFAAEKFEELLKKTLEEYHNRRATLSSAEATQTQKDTVDEIIRNATQQALDILSKLGEDKESFRKLGLTFEEKAFYDILMHMRDVHNFEYGTDRKVGSLIINDKCKALAKKVKELIDTQSCFADWLSNTNVRAKLNQDLWFLLDENGYPPEWSDDVFDQVLDQVENYKEHQSAPRLYSVNTDYYPFMVAEP